MSINLKTRGLVFVTFFGSCIIIALLVAALTTESWVQAQARHRKVAEGEGRIKFGLFSGSKNLNTKFGWRFNTTDVQSLLRDDVIQYTWWLLTTLGVGFGLLSSFIAGNVYLMNIAIQILKISLFNRHCVRNSCRIGIQEAWNDGYSLCE